LIKRAILLVKKDIAIELSQFRAVGTIAIMSILIILIFALAMGQAISAAQAGAVLAISFLFCGIVAVERSFDSETQNGAMDAMRSMGQTDFIFWGKCLFVAGFLLAVEIWICLVFAVMFNFDLFSFWLGILVLLCGFNISFAAVGVVFSAMLAKCRGKGFLLTLLVLPVLISPVIAITSGLKVVLSGGGLGEISNWLKFLAGFDVVFVGLAWISFEKVLE